MIAFYGPTFILPAGEMIFQNKAGWKTMRDYAVPGYVPPPPPAPRQRCPYCGLVLRDDAACRGCGATR